MKTEREKRLANLIGRYLEIQDHTCAGCDGDSCGVGSAHQALVEDMREALSDEGSGSGEASEPRRNWCGNCGRELGLHEKCPDCQPDDTPAQRRDALEVLDIAEQSLSGEANLDGRNCRIGYITDRQIATLRRAITTDRNPSESISSGEVDRGALEALERLEVEHYHGDESHQTEDLRANEDFMTVRRKILDDDEEPKTEALDCFDNLMDELGLNDSVEHGWRDDVNFIRRALSKPAVPKDPVRPEYALHCDECGRAHILDTSLPSHIWNQIAKPEDILCAVCIDQRLIARGMTAEAEFYFAGNGLQSKLYDPEPAVPEAVRRLPERMRRTANITQRGTTALPLINDVIGWAEELESALNGCGHAVPKAVRNFPDDMRREATRLDEAPGDSWAKARADVLRRRADELDHALAQHGERVPEDDEIVRMLRDSGLLKIKGLTCEHFKDGIGITRPTVEVTSFVKRLLAAAPEADGEDG